MTGGDDSILGGPNEGDEGESGQSDGTNCRTGSRIGNSDGAVMTFGGAFNMMSVERNKMGLPANARTSPDGEKETACTQPPAELANSPQTVPNGSFSPQNVGAGLNNAIVNLSYHQAWRGNADFLSTSLIYAEKTRAFMSALPAASRTLFGCQSMESTVDLIGFLRSFETHQSLSSSKEQTAIALVTAGQCRPRLQQATGRKPRVVPGSTSNGELVLKRTPADESSGTVDI